MKASDLIEFLGSFDDDQELCILIDFPDLKGWSVSSYDIGYSINEEDVGKGPMLKTAIYLADFDYPQILRDLKDVVAAAPEACCAL